MTLAEYPQSREKLTGRNVPIIVFISGYGSNLQSIIDWVEEGSISADIVGVASNNENAFGLDRARKSEIDTKVVSYKGKLREKAEDEFLKYITDRQPKVIVLAGFMKILSDNFLTEVQKLGITVINLHPALLPKDGADMVMTSLGIEIPALRGVDKIEEAFNKGLPVSGVTVHQVLPKLSVDKGPIILTREVIRTANETLESWEKKIHAVEHQVLPDALKRVVEAIKQGIDVGKGDFDWQKDG